MAIYSIQGKLVALGLQGGIQPSIMCTLEVTVPTQLGNIELRTLRLISMSGVLSAVAKEGELPIGPLEPAGQEFNGNPGYPFNCQARAWITPSAIENLERLRLRGTDKHLRFRFLNNLMWAIGWLTGKDDKETGPQSFQINPGEYRYVRDDWLNALTQIEYRRWRVYEAPDFDLPKEWNITEHLDQAWLVLRQGYPDTAMQECQKAMEGIKKVLKEKGYFKKDNDGKDNIDFERLTSSDTLGETLDKMFSGAFGFQQPGRHHGKAIRYEDGEFAVLSVHAFVSYIARLLNTNP